VWQLGQDTQPGTDRSLCVVFVRDGIPEVHQQPVALILGDMSGKIPDHLGARFLILARNLTDLFRVQALGAGHRVHRVAKHNRQMSPLSFASSFLFLLGDEGGSALAAEGEARGIVKAALGTAQPQGGRALAAKLHALRILNPTARTTHAASLLLRALRGKETA